MTQTTSTPILTPIDFPVKKPRHMHWKYNISLWMIPAMLTAIVAGGMPAYALTGLSPLSGSASEGVVEQAAANSLVLQGSDETYSSGAEGRSLTVGERGEFARIADALSAAAGW
jgi:hypothetical protein